MFLSYLTVREDDGREIPRTELFFKFQRLSAEQSKQNASGVTSLGMAGVRRNGGRIPEHRQEITV